MVATNETPLDAGATNYPGAFAQPRLWAAEACPGRAGRFRRVDDFNCASVALPRLNINGTDTYQFVVGNPVGRVDPSDFDCEEYLREHQKALQEAAKAQREIQKDLEKLNTCPPPSLLKRVELGFDIAAKRVEQAGDMVKAESALVAYDACRAIGSAGSSPAFHKVVIGGLIIILILPKPLPGPLP